MKLSAATLPDGFASHRRIVRPSPGNFARRIAAWSARMRPFVRAGATTTHSPMAAGSHPRSFAIRRATRPRTSIVAIRSLMSTIRVLSSITSIVREAACQATMSMTPRSRPYENETSGTASQPPTMVSQEIIAS